MELKTNIERCKACGFCIRSCAKGALKLSDYLNAAGYHYVVLDEEVCNQCGICYVVCPDGVFEIVDVTIERNLVG